MISLFVDFSVKHNLMMKNRPQIVKDFSDIFFAGTWNDVAKFKDEVRFVNLE